MIINKNPIAKLDKDIKLKITEINSGGTRKHYFKICSSQIRNLIFTCPFEVSQNIVVVDISGLKVPADIVITDIVIF